MVLIRWRSALLPLILAVTTSACGDAERAALVGSGTNLNGKIPNSEPCEPGAARECGVELGPRAGVITCYHGTQTCDSGTWGPCEHGTIETLSLPPSTPGFHPLALSIPIECVDNPCDPGCQIFEEEPTTPIETVSTTPTYDWETGSLAGFPNGLVKKGLVEPCETGLDCQLNTYCSAPSQGSCDHSVCEAGDPLETECSSCATAVCAEDPSCCEEVVENDTCEHDPCARGDDLKTGCNSCVTKICAAYPSCCTNSGAWDATCVAAVTTICGNSCECAEGTAYNGRCYKFESDTTRGNAARSACEDLSDSGDWDLVGISNAAENTFVRTWGDSTNVWIGIYETSTNNVWTWTGGSPSGTWNQSTNLPASFYTNWNSSQPGSSSCAIMAATTTTSLKGKWTGKSCNSSSASYARVCEGPPEQMVKAPTPTPDWTAACVDLVAEVCDARCDEDEPSNTAGTCTPWYPGETDPACAGIDLAIGVPCDDTIPVCNHGQTAAPSGIRVVHFPANSQQYPLTDPDESHPQMKECFTSEPIPPGECINLTTCPGLTGNRELMVNPGTTVAECSQLDNWSLYSGGTCGAPICAGGSSSASFVRLPVDIIISVDNSVSMQGEIEAVQDRINSDLAEILDTSGIDYRVILVTRYGNVHDGGYDGGVYTDSEYSVCIGAPLTSLSCPTSSLDSTPAVAHGAPNFYHHSTDIGSNNLWCRLLESYDEADSYPVTRSGWTSIAPTGWGAFLREEAFKVFIAITDDNPLATSSTYTHGGQTLARDCPNMLGNANHDGTNDLAGAQDFDAALRTLAPEHFGAVGGDRNYIWHSIVGMTGDDDEPLAPTDPVESRCCRLDRGVDNVCQGTTGTRFDDAANAGEGYQHLSILTGGLRYPSCYNDNFDGVFNTIAEDVIVQAAASCDVVLANAASFDPTLTTVVYSSVNSSGADVQTSLTRVADAAACTTNAWYADDSSGSTTIKLCPTICATVKADVNARVWAELACGTDATTRTESFVYSGVCDADEGTTWLDLGYEATIPDDGSVVFRARVAATEALLQDATWVDLRTALAAQASCALASGCEIDVFAALGSAEAQLPALELEITLNPTSSGDSVSIARWDLTYTCQDNQ
jgi:hypothetical protein